MTEGSRYIYDLKMSHPRSTSWEEQLNGISIDHIKFRSYRALIKTKKDMFIELTFERRARPINNNIINTYHPIDQSKPTASSAVDLP